MPPYQDIQEKSKQQIIYRERAKWFDAAFLNKHDCDFDIVYVGDEFCQRCLPDEHVLREVLSWAKGKDLKVVLVSPILTNKGMSYFKKLLSIVCSDNQSAEIVVNDWGALSMVKRDFSSLAITMGRALSAKFFPPGPFLNTEEGLSSGLKWEIPDFLSSAQEYCSDSVINILRAHNIMRIELNAAYQAKALEAVFKEKNIKAHLYVPYTFVCRAKLCNCINEFKGYYRLSVESCDKECQRIIGVLNNSDHTKEIIIKGNAYFVDQREWAIKVNAKVERVIINDYFSKN